MSSAHEQYYDQDRYDLPVTLVPSPSPEYMGLMLPPVTEPTDFYVRIINPLLDYIVSQYGAECWIAGFRPVFRIVEILSTTGIDGQDYMTFEFQYNDRGHRTIIAVLWGRVREARNLDKHDPRAYLEPEDMEIWMD